MTTQLSTEARAALIAAVQVHGFAQVLRELADEALRQLATLAVDDPERGRMARLHTELIMMAGELEG